MIAAQTGQRVFALLFLLPLLAFPLLTGCEETLSGTDVELPYKEEIVIQGYLTQGRGGDTILITRTLPPLEKWSFEKAVLNDAVVTLTVDGQNYTYQSLGRGRYVLPDVTIENGRVYRLTVTAHGLKAEATASIPSVDGIAVGSFGQDTVENGCTFVDRDGSEVEVPAERLYFSFHQDKDSGTIYGYSYDIFQTYNGAPYNYTNGPFFIYESERKGDSNLVIISYNCLDGGISPGRSRYDSMYVQIFQYEPAFTSYYNTRWNDGDDLFFGSGGEQPDWNVTGDGFGWFFGRAIKSDTLRL